MSNESPSITVEQMEQIVKLFNPCMDDYLYVYDLTQDYYAISSHATERFLFPVDHFYHAEEMHTHFVYPEDMILLKEEFRQIREGNISFHNLHYRWLDKDGIPVWINCRGRVLYDEDRKPHFLVGCINEIGQKQKADNVSGLLGESSLCAYVEQFRDCLPKGFILRIGIDDFKEINGDIGIKYGDFILKRTADCIHAEINARQKLYRLVADEFMIVDFAGGSEETAELLYRRIRNRIDRFIEEIGYKSVFTISAGVVGTEILEPTHDHVMKLSEFALNEAKNRGKNRCYLFRQEDYQAFLRKNELIRQLHNAVNHQFEGFEAYYQPIVDANTYRLLGAEALMRFFVPGDKSSDTPDAGPGGAERQMISPAEFIPLLEETGLIIPAGKWMLRQAFATCVKWQKYIPDFRININLSYIQVIKSKVLTEIMEAIRITGVRTSCVGIELTESGYLDSNSHFRKLWDGLKDIGVEIIVDDFGTGYSNLQSLGELRPTYIKIDRSFTARALNSEFEHNLMIKIIEMTHSLNLGICIEGIETSEELAKVRKLKPDYIQGYLFGKPYDESEFVRRFMQGDRKDGDIPAESVQSAF